MSERSEAPRPGGRAAQPRDTRRVSRDAETKGDGVRGARRSERGDTRRSGMRGEKGPEATARSGMRSRKAADTTAPVDGATALSIEVSGDTPPMPGRPRLWVAPPLPVRAPRATFAAAIIAVVLVGVVGILLINTKTMEQSFRLDALRKEKTTLDKRQQELDRQIYELSGPGNLHAAARRLGLVQADEPAVIWLPNGDIVRPPAPGRGPTAPTADDGLRETGAPSTAAER
ncbi:hypothetical protein Ait01nite_080130 [Actinoplanes italicus]|uniref:Septum formation initiator n=1 Tax=Actinoplanes italicus TaxID=113567 RepID=A0A2T0KJX2_9ACTN|nr:hypothetical protein [Actinoplanes italicus]PRX23830.1 hypothetical protein CLV67_103580 [Actinoplanes italicus]GIE34968.1 hypothetical protein Ait01nite_080130 [Actinoplanes italicus]